MWRGPWSNQCGHSVPLASARGSQTTLDSLRAAPEPSVRALPGQDRTRTENHGHIVRIVSATANVNYDYGVSPKELISGARESL